MNGVEILATEQVAVAFGFDWGSFIGYGILCGIVLAFGFWCVSTIYSLNLGGTIAMIIVGLLLGMGIGVGVGFANDGAPTAYETHYKVLISDEVSMNEFLEQYEIIDQEGKIFIVREVE